MSMYDIDSTEAKVILSKAGFCEPTDWVPEHNGTCHEMHSAVLDSDGKTRSLQVRIRVTVRPSTRITRIAMMLYTIGKSTQRVYALEVSNAKVSNTAHEAPHEHIGKSIRNTGDESWRQWGFSECLAHFCSRTQISFNPELEDPTSFKLVKS